MRLDRYAIDPWANRQPRRRDWLVLAVGVVLLAAGAVAQIEGSAGATAGSGTPVDASRWQEATAQTRELNIALGEVGRPWSRWLEHAIRIAGPESRLERFEPDPEARRISMVWLAPSADAGPALAAALAGLPGASSARVTRSEPAGDGTRLVTEVTLR